MTNRRLNVKDVAYISVLAALCVLATFIKIPFGSGAMVHLGTGMVFTSGILFGGVYAGWAAAIGIFTLYFLVVLYKRDSWISGRNDRDGTIS